MKSEDFVEFSFQEYGNLPQEFIWQMDVFNDKELDILQQVAVNAQSAAWTVSADGERKSYSDTRRTNVEWLFNTPEWSWVYERINAFVDAKNAKHYGFALSRIQSIQLGNYRSDMLGTYDWHNDDGSVIPCRKLSLSILLSDPSEFDGGDLMINTGMNNIHTISKKRGILTLFPSYLYHKVSPVTRGSRQSLVAWISGPRFK